jgi:hypothetical protein
MEGLTARFAITCYDYNAPHLAEKTEENTTEMTRKIGTMLGIAVVAALAVGSGAWADSGTPVGYDVTGGTSHGIIAILIGLLRSMF